MTLNLFKVYKVVSKNEADSTYRVVIYTVPFHRWLIGALWHFMDMYVIPRYLQRHLCIPAAVWPGGKMPLGAWLDIKCYDLNDFHHRELYSFVITQDQMREWFPDSIFLRATRRQGG